MDLPVGWAARSGWGARDHIALSITDAVVARAEELLPLVDPANATSEVRADIGHGDVAAAIVCQDVGSNLSSVGDPSRLSFRRGLEQGGLSKFNLGGGAEGEPSLLCAFEGRPD